MFDDITIFIPTKGRSDKLPTLINLSPELLSRTSLVVDNEEFDDYEDYTLEVDSIRPLPKGLTGIHNVRQFCLDKCETQYMFLIDDDMTFFNRIPESTKLEKMSDLIINKAFQEMIDSLEEYPLVGMSARQGNNHVAEDYREATRQMNFHGVDVAEFRKLGLRFDGQEVMEDFHLTLSLLSLGIPNKVFYKYCWNQIGSGESGGCSSYRTWEVQKRCAEQLAAKFPDFVTVVKKKTTSTWKEFGERYDVRVQWKKAYEKGVQDNEF
jgi:hypothetical protein